MNILVRLDTQVHVCIGYVLGSALLSSKLVFSLEDTAEQIAK